MNDQNDRFRSDRPKKKPQDRNRPGFRSNDSRQDLRFGQGQQGQDRRFGGGSGGGNYQGGGGRNGGRGGPGGNPGGRFQGQRPGQGGHNQGGGQGQSGQNRGQHHRHRDQGRPPQQQQQSIRNADGRLDIFELFCAYHLGITADGRYRQQNIHDLARRFGCTPAELKQALVDYHMDPQTLINSDFDLALAQLDMQVAPEGVDRRELAKTWFEEFLNAKPNARDWAKEIENDAQENQKIFGK